MSELKVNKISPRSGTAVTLGDSGDTFTIPSGATLAIAGTVTGFTSAGIDDNATSVAITIDSSERVGIGNTSPTGALDVKSGTQPQLKVATASPTASYNAGFLVTASNSATAGSRSVLLSLDADGGDGSGTDNLTIIKIGNGGDAFIRNQNNANLILGTNNSERMRITSAGDVFIGDSSPAYSSRLTVSGNGSTDTGLFMYDGNAGTFFEITTNAANGVVDLEANARSGSYPPLTFTTSDSERMRINSNGNIGIGTTSPAQKLDVNGVISSSSELRLNNAYTKVADADAQGGFAGGYNINVSTNEVQHSVNGSAYGIHYSSSALKFNTNGSASGGTAVPERMRIDSSGNVYIGKTSGVLANVGHEFNAGSYASHTRDGDVTLYLNRKSSVGAIQEFRKDNTAVGSIGIQTGGLTVDGEANHSGIRFSASSFLPRKNNADVNGTVDLGTTDGRWKDLYLAGGAFLGGTGTANKLEDYEEGSFTPSFAATNCSFNYTQRFGNYTKIGRVVHCKIFLRAQSSGSTSNALKITALPFTSSNTNGMFASCTFGQIYIVDLTDASRIVGQVGKNNTQIDLQFTVDNSASGNLVASAIDNSTSAGFIVDVTYFTDA